MILDQTNDFLSLRKILCGYESGFRMNHSTDLCIYFLDNKVLKRFGDNVLTGMKWYELDVQKTFDMVNLLIFQKTNIIVFTDDTI